MLMSRCWMISSPARLCAGREVGEGRKGGRIGSSAADMHMHAPTPSATAKPHAGVQAPAGPSRRDVSRPLQRGRRTGAHMMMSKRARVSVRTSRRGAHHAPAQQRIGMAGVLRYQVVARAPGGRVIRRAGRGREGREARHKVRSRCYKGVLRGGGGRHHIVRTPKQPSGVRTPRRGRRRGSAGRGRRRLGGCPLCIRSTGAGGLLVNCGPGSAVRETAPRASLQRAAAVASSRLLLSRARISRQARHAAVAMRTKLGPHKLH